MKRLLQPVLRKIIYVVFKYKIRKRFKYHLTNHEPVAEPYKCSPVVVIGMHRSGTTLLTSLLEDMNVHMGYIKGHDTEESLPFQCLNDALFNFAHAHWDHPSPFTDEMQRYESIFLAVLKDCLASWVFKFHDRNFGNRLNMVNDEPWGWKDPRNTYTLPLWIKLFPNARVIHIFRNGIDVSNSLKVRNYKLPVADDLSLRTLNLEGGLQLWKEYIDTALSNLSQISKDSQMSICYEILNQHPMNELKQLADFIAWEGNDETLNKIAGKMNVSRVYSFTSNEKLKNFYEHNKDIEPFKKLKYQDIV